MKTFKFSKLLGTVYRKGNVLLTADGFTLISPVGNRITVYDLKNHETCTLPVEFGHNVECIALSPNECVLVAATEIGEVHIISLVTKTAVHCLKVGRNISCIRFSPNGEYFAVAKEGTVFIYRAPLPKKCFNPFSMERVFNTGNTGVTINTISWSFDSRLIAFGSSDMMTRIHSLAKFSNFKHTAFTGHSDALVSCSFAQNSYLLYSVSRNGQLCEWECTHEPSEFLMENSPKESADKDDEDEDSDSPTKRHRSTDGLSEESTQSRNQVRFKKAARNYYADLFKTGEKRPQITCADFNVRETTTVVTGFSDGSFFIHLLPDFELMTSLNIENQEISTITFNNSSFYIAVGCAKLGQLLVWEWPSETYVMKQQGHTSLMNSFDFSPDGRYIASGGEDMKVKVWDACTSFCFVTFTEHTASITGVRFTQNGKAIISASLDGTVRAYDLTRYRNFRTFTTPRPVQFSCVAVDASRQFIAAGGQDVFEIYVWSMNTGRLLEVLSGHEGPVTAVLFSPNIGSTLLASASWDKTLRLWEAIESTSRKETIELNCEATSLAFRPDGKQVAVGTLDSNIAFFEVANSTQSGSVEGRNHLGAGRSETDKITARKNLEAKAFTTLCYSADGTGLLAAGQSKNICYYDTSRKVLIMKYEITQNRSLDAMDEFLHHRKMSEFGNLDLVEDRDGEFSDTLRLPGVKKGDMAARLFKPEVRVACVNFCPTGRSWGAASTEGLFLYSCDAYFMFDPLGADEKVTPGSAKNMLHEQHYDSALIMALRLNMAQHIREVVENIPSTHISAVCHSLPVDYSVLLIQFLGEELGRTKHLQFYTTWINTLLEAQLLILKSQTRNLLPAVNLVEKNLIKKQEDILSLCGHNKYFLQYLLKARSGATSQAKGLLELEDASFSDSSSLIDDASIIDDPMD